MESSVLLKPSKKKRGKDFFDLEAPFPIFAEVDSSTELQGFGRGAKRKCFFGDLQDNCVLVADKNSIKTLYTMGFFGKGTMSKRVPKVCCTSKSSEGDAEPRKSAEDSGSESSDDEERDWKRKKSSASQSQAAEAEDSAKTVEDEEKLQLTFEEAFFLSYGLGCLIVVEKNQPMDLMRLWHRLCDLTPDQKFPVMYTAYHHFRSKGWVVRSGLKYGVDYVLYRDGPLYYHSTYAVIVKLVKEKNLKDIHKGENLPLSWSSLAATNRVVTHSGKGLMFLYVIKPEMMSENKVSTPFCVSQFKLQEVLVKRWVPSEGREEEEG